MIKYHLSIPYTCPVRNTLYDKNKPRNIINKISNGMSFLNTILDILYPVNCISCNKTSVYFCINCLAECPETERESAEWILPVYDYRHTPIKKALWLLKYKGKIGFANIFADQMYGKILEEFSELSVMQNFKNPILIPIPLSARRYRERGYNQAELLCRGLVKLDGNKNFKLEKNVLIKTKETEHQARIKERSDRLKNLIGSFEVRNPELIQGRNIILIDDITTTGTTLNEARKILKKSGAKKIIAFTVAH